MFPQSSPCMTHESLIVYTSSQKKKECAFAKLGGAIRVQEEETFEFNCLMSLHEGDN